MNRKVETEVTVSKPTICHVLHTLNVGGAEVLAQELALRFRDEFTIVFACLDTDGTLASNLRTSGFDVEVIGRKPGFDLACAGRLRAFLRAHNVGLVHAHQYAPFFYSALSRLWRASPPILFTEHGRDFPDYPRRKRQLANRVLLRPSDHVVGVGKCVKVALENNEGLPSDRVNVIYNGIDMCRFDPERAFRSEVRNELGIGDEHILIVQVARLNRLKDHATALDALRILGSSQPEVRLALVGDGEERSRLEAKARDSGVAGMVSFVGERRDVSRILQAADVFLLSSLTEGIPLTLIEAMATGVACVATNVGGIPEVLDDGINGLTCEPSSPSKLAEKLAILCDDENLRTRLGLNGLLKVQGQFESRLMYEAYERDYRRMLNA